MTFEEWATEYFGANVSVPESCRDAWKAAALAEREACAAIADSYEDQAESDIAENISYDIRKRGRK